MVDGIGVSAGDGQSSHLCVVRDECVSQPFVLSALLGQKFGTNANIKTWSEEIAFFVKCGSDTGCDEHQANGTVSVHAMRAKLRAGADHGFEQVCLDSPANRGCLDFFFESEAWLFHCGWSKPEFEVRQSSLAAFEQGVQASRMQAFCTMLFAPLIEKKNTCNTRSDQQDDPSSQQAIDPFPTSSF
jgi:hypothetical protein